jgi:hypothetical protein
MQQDLGSMKEDDRQKGEGREDRERERKFSYLRL